MSNKILPLIYAYLPNKKYETYLTLFELIKKNLDIDPLSISVDFEKAVFKAAFKIFPCIKVYGCFFHLSQNLYKRVIKYQFIIYFNSDESFRNSYNMTQALAYLPVEDVELGFEIVKSTSCSKFDKILHYFEKTYIGRHVTNKKGVQKYKSPRFNIESWSVHKRVLSEIWRTTNHVESWHGSFSPNVENGLTCATLTEALRLEQQNTETLITQINTGKIFKII